MEKVGFHRINPIFYQDHINFTWKDIKDKKPPYYCTRGGTVKIFVAKQLSFYMGLF